MENRKHLRFVIPVLVLGFFILNTPNVFAYGVETHAFLTKEIADFYSKNFANKKINAELAQYLVDGSRLEDNLPRYMNHFYDPVNDRGLADGIYRGIASKVWSQNPDAQMALLYRILPQTEASLLTAMQIEKIQPVFNQTDFTWEKAIELYAKGENEQAMFALGHILHLIEDVSVPDHTRNDPHPPFDGGGSPYENWTAKFNLENPDKELVTRMGGKKPLLADTLDAYFNAMAGYSNNNFYSRDSIKNYELPKPDYVEKDANYNYGFKKDGDEAYRLVVVKNYTGKYDWHQDNELSLSSPGTDIVMQDYWSRLSAKAVQYGAGVIDLFFKEAEKARDEYLASEIKKPMFARVADAVGSLFSGERVKTIDEVVYEAGVSKADISPKSQQEPPKKSVQSSSSVKPDNAVALASVADAVNQASVAETPKAAPFQFCSFSTAKTPTHQNLIINEVAWMGSANSANDEWIELKNISGEEIDLSGWQVIDLGEQIKIQLSGKLPAGGFYLLERTDDSSVPGPSADQIYVGALSNAGEGLRLFNKNCDLADEVFASPDWPAGDNAYKKTMERAADFSWRNYNGDGSGTPKAENSPGTAPVNNGGGGANQNTANQPVVSQTEPPAEQQQSSSATSEPPKVLISEILFDADGSDVGKEFIELYNAGGQAADISGWSIQHVSPSGAVTKKNFEAGDAIAPKSFFLIWLGTDARADLTWSSGSLNNTGATIYLVDNTIAVSTTSVPVSVDAASYNVADLPGFLPGQSLERKAVPGGVCASAQNDGEFLGNGCDTGGSAGSPQGDWELRTAPNPQNIGSLAEPRLAPEAVENFNAEASQLSINFNWDADDSLIYELRNISDPANPITIATTSDDTATLAIKEIGRDYTFSIKATDSGGLSSSVVEKTVFAPSFFSGLDFYRLSDGPDGYRLDLRYEAYPFVPNFDGHGGYKIIIFYLNKDAPVIPDTLATAENWQPDSSSGALQMTYRACAGGYPQRFSLILPDTQGNCGTDGGVMNSAFDFKFLEDNRLEPTAISDSNFSATDYLTAAYYTFYYSGGGSQGFKLIAVDKTKNFFRTDIPINQPPTIPGNLLIEGYDEASRRATISFDPSTDPDGLDRFIEYGYNFTNATGTEPDFSENSWAQASFVAVDGTEPNHEFRLHARILINPELTYTFGFRARDEYGNYSPVATIGPYKP
ncbi:MAG: hypothetical protein UY24_C0011G0015 [Parcubacteria group bacterium GW2011_GWA1_48_11b]|nr:MAG: hypothetical protein UY24_C0011G0015 [Parcubacteria group bacterium GW2011_GWA1_48_11b]